MLVTPWNLIRPWYIPIPILIQFFVYKKKQFGIILDDKEMVVLQRIGSFRGWPSTKWSQFLVEIHYSTQLAGLVFSVGWDEVAFFELACSLIKFETQIQKYSDFLVFSSHKATELDDGKNDFGKPRMIYWEKPWFPVTIFPRRCTSGGGDFHSLPGSWTLGSKHLKSKVIHYSKRWDISDYMYTCMYISCLYVYIYIYTCMCIYIYIYTYVCMYVCMYVCIYIYILVCL